MSSIKSYYKNPGIVPWVFMLIATVTLATLGSWQISRMHWKEALLEQIKLGQEMPPLGTLPADKQELEKVIYRRVALSGEMLRHLTILRIGIHRDYGNGYYVLSPLKLTAKDGDAPVYILANRGFISGDQAAVKKALVSEELSNPTLAEGIIRPAYAPRFFSPSNHPDKNVWSSEDVPAIEKEFAATHGVTMELLPYVIEVTSEKPAKGEAAPHSNHAEIRFRNDHFGYAVTWFGIAIAGVVMFGFYCRKAKA